MDERTAEELRAALTALASPGRSGPEVAAALDRVEALARELPDNAPAQLRHFLERRSYVKALEWLEARAKT